jgi:hypothetical protein
MKKSDITFVTALFDIGREHLASGFSRSFEHYKECFSKLLKYQHINLVVYCEESLNEFVQSHKKENIKIINRSLKELESFPFVEQVEKIRNTEAWLNQAGWLAQSPQAKLKHYNLITMQKQFMLNDSSIFNHFKTNMFCWIDSGLANTVNLDQYFNEKEFPLFERKLIKHLNKMLYVCFPYDGQIEVHGFTKAGMNRYAGTDTTHVARGGFFGGNRYHIEQINNLYYQLLASTLDDGLMGTEESVFTLITYKHPELCNIRMIEGNGLVCKFFEDVKNSEVSGNSEQTAIYALTYNLPNQFQYWVENFVAVYPEIFNSCKKYVVNNSTDAATSAQYKELFDKYNFEEFKFDNIGINSARQFIAEHFNESGHEYYIMFEDDMLFHTTNTICKSGFNTYHKNWLNKCITIMQNENLDYLKTSFSEFFGDNFVDWAWYNVPKERKSKYFTTSIHKQDEKLAKIHYINVYESLPYSVGHHHYCNWPLVFNKSGNTKVFLDTKWAHTYEQTWMSHVESLQQENKIRSGCLLMSLTNHHRKYHYAPKSRRENDKYTN